LRQKPGLGSAGQQPPGAIQRAVGSFVLPLQEGVTPNPGLCHWIE